MCTFSPTPVPLVYTCAGASNLAQLANDIGLWLHQQGYAQMSSIAGVAGQTTDHLEALYSGRKVIAVDGCHRQCVRRCLTLQQTQADWHVQLDKHVQVQHRDGSCSLHDTFKAMRVVGETLGVAVDEHFADHLQAPLKSP